MRHLPFYIPAVFILATLLTIYLFYKASGRNMKLLMIIATWMTIQSAIAVSGFFTIENTMPPRFLLLILLPIIGIITTFSTVKGKLFIDGFDLKTLTLLHSIRIAIEMVLFWLFLDKLMPQLMTFEGRNFDLVSGISAPLIYYFGFVKKTIGIKAIIAWNCICLAILLFTVSNAILSAPTPLQRFAFDQPTIAVFYFPFVLLPGIVVPLVIFSHLITVRLLIKEIRQKNISSSPLFIKQVAEL
jgi:hypothetical protein